VLKITVILIQSLKFPRAVLRGIPDILVFDLLLLEVLQRLLVPLQLELVVVAGGIAIAVVGVLQVVDDRLLLVVFAGCVHSIVLGDLIAQIIFSLIGPFPARSSVLHLEVIIIEHIIPMVLRNQVLSGLVLHQVTRLQLLRQLSVQVHAHVE